MERRPRRPGPSSKTAPRGPSLRRFLSAAFAIVGALALAAPVRAQVAFTEFALSDSTLNSGPDTDFWISSAAPADVDADGDLDLLVAGYWVVYNVSFEDRLTLYRNDGAIDDSTWALTAVPLDATGLAFTRADLAWADYDNDGDPDVVVAGFESTTLYRNDGGSLLRTSTTLPPYREDSDFSTLDLQSVSWADVDNDGDPDLCLPSTVGDFGWLPTVILRNDGAGAGDAWTFTDSGTTLPTSPNAVSAWGDVEGDGDLDLLLANVSPWGDSFLDVYRNDGGVYALADSGLAHVRYGMIDWGDSDGDGDLDVVYAGNIDLPDGTGESVVRILRNDGPGAYTPIDVATAFGGPSSPWLDFTAVSWADYDSDGQVELLVSGEWLGSTVGRYVVYQDSAGTWVPEGDPLPAPIAGNAGGAFTWFDVDADNDLDYFVAGGYYVEGGNGLIEARTQLFRNDAAAANEPPSAPGNVQVDVQGAQVVPSWLPAVDDDTHQDGLTYRLTIVDGGTIPFYEGVLRSLGERVIPERGNVDGDTQWTLQDLPDGYYGWTLRALDSAFNGSVPVSGQFTVGETVGAPSPAPAPAGGGLRLSRPHPNPSEGGSRVMLSLDRSERVTVALFDVAGRRVAVLHDGLLAAGTHAFTLDPVGRLPQGVYFVRASAGGRTASARWTRVR